MNVDLTECWVFFDAIFCISLAERSDRRASAEREFARVGLLDRVEFVIVEKHPDNPEQGIYRSHLLCLEKGLAAGAETILVFEDDILLHGFDVTRLSHACKRLVGQGWELFSLGCMISGLKRTTSPELVRIRFQCLTHANAVHRCFAESLVRIPWQGIPYDTMLRQQQERDGGFFALYPMIAFQSEATTDNHTLKIDRARRLLGGLQRLQQLNEWFQYHKKAVIIGHVVVTILVTGGVYFWFLR